MTSDELRDFIAEQMVMECATMGPNGLPHLVPLWFVPSDGELRGWTYAKSQKAKNLERDPRATIGIHAGVSSSAIPPRLSATASPCSSVTRGT